MVDLHHHSVELVVEVMAHRLELGDALLDIVDGGERLRVFVDREAERAEPRKGLGVRVEFGTALDQTELVAENDSSRSEVTAASTWRNEPAAVFRGLT